MSATPLTTSADVAAMADIELCPSCGALPCDWTQSPAQWQPIETAPKDGSPFVAGRFTGEKRNHDGLIQVDRWHDRTKGDSYNGLGRFNRQFWPATHWMPLPSAPGLTDNWPEGE